MAAEWWYNQGLAVAMLAMLCLALWRFVYWSRKSIVEPIVASHLKLVETLCQEIPKQTAALVALAKAAQDKKQSDKPTGGSDV